jgi:hypothetical protein
MPEPSLENAFGNKRNNRRAVFSFGPCRGISGDRQVQNIVSCKEGSQLYGSLRTEGFVGAVEEPPLSRSVTGKRVVKAD